MLHAQLGAFSRHAAQKPMVWSVARQLGKRRQHFAALKNTGHYDDRLEPPGLIHIFQYSAFCDDICWRRMRFGITLYNHEAEPAKIAAWSQSRDSAWMIAIISAQKASAQ
jgi:hypothetical protein